MQSSKDSDAVYTPTDLKFLQRCLSLAEEALYAGDQPFGSILVNANNEIIVEARNRTCSFPKTPNQPNNFLQEIFHQNL